jgi:hypothetical protein
MVGYELYATLSEHGTVSRGVCEIEDSGDLKTVVENLKVEKLASGARDQASGRLFTGKETVSLNFFGFTPSMFGHLQDAFEAFLRRDPASLKGEFQLPGVVDALIKSGQAGVRVLHSRDAWFGITYREDKPRVADSIGRLVAAGRYPANLRPAQP